MKKLITLLLFLAALEAEAQTIVIDSESHRPLGGVLVFNKSGSYIDMTDSLGHLPQNAVGLDGVTLQDIAHKSLSANLPADTLRMKPVEYQLDEVNVSRKADYLKLRGYYRKYSIANDTMMRYEDGMADYYIPLKGGKSRVVYYLSRQGAPGKTPLCYAGWGDLFDDYDIDSKTVMEQVREQKRHYQRDTVSYITTDTINGITTAYLDALATDKNHSITVNFIIKVKLTEADMKGVYKYDPAYESQSQLMSYINHNKVWVSGKLIRKAKQKGDVPFSEICEDDFREFYVVDRDIVSKNEMKEVWNEAKRGDNDILKRYDKECVIPDFVPMLSDKLLQQLELLKSLTKDQWEGKNIIVPTKDSK